MINNAQFDHFLQKITERIEREGEFNLHYEDLVAQFGFDPPYWKELIQKMQIADPPFVSGGQAWFATGEPSIVCFSPKDTTNHNRTRSGM